MLSIQACTIREFYLSKGCRLRSGKVFTGPQVRRYQFGLGENTTVKKVLSHTQDLRIHLENANITVSASDAIYIDVPRQYRDFVQFRVPEFAGNRLYLGRDQFGHDLCPDLDKLPHLLVAGATGSGKSVCINTIICSTLHKNVKHIMIDPKQVELTQYGTLNKLLIPVVTNPNHAATVLKSVCTLMDSRYREMSKTGSRKYDGPHILVTVDELADLMLQCGKDVEPSIVRLAQLGRAARIHLLLATQRPTVNVVTGLIKANIPSRIAFTTASAVDSLTILDRVGSEKLLGKGDGLFHQYGDLHPVRFQGAYLSDEEIQQLIERGNEL